MPASLKPAAPEAIKAYEATGSLELVGRQCKLKPYKKIKVPFFQIKGEFIAYASPDSTWAVTKRFIDEAKHSILIGIYDFTAVYVKELLLKAMRRGVKVTLMLDLDGRTGETPLFEDLQRRGADCTPAPSCASKRVHYFRSSHEKVIVIDDEWTLVQSGNYSENSIPQNDRDGGDRASFVPGNRDMGVAVRSKRLAGFFAKLLLADIKLEQKAPAPQAALGLEDLPTAEATQPAPAQVPPQLFRSKLFKPAQPISVLPVLSPDNYLDVLPGALAAATKSIRIEEQYIRGAQPHIETLLESVRKAMDAHPKLSVQIVLAKPFPSARTFDKEAQEIRNLGKAFGLKLGTHVRILNPQFFVHCHNKLIVIDDRSVLVSSQNWSDAAVADNREAGLLIESGPIARYFTKVFQVDWESGLKKLSRGKPRLFAPEALGTGKMVPLNWGDYAEV